MLIQLLPDIEGIEEKVILERENILEYIRKLELFTRFGLFCLMRFVQVDISG